MRLLWGMVVDVLEVGGLPAVPSAIIDDLAVDLTTGDVDEGHGALILEELVNGALDGATKLDVDHPLLGLVAAAAHTLQHTLQLVGGAPREDFDEADVCLPVENDDKQPLFADQRRTDALMDALL